MIVFSNHRLGPAAELLVSPEVAEGMLEETANAASSSAANHWERELVRWLRARAGASAIGLDVSELAWSPEHFERQRQFLIAAIEKAATTSLHARALSLWAAMIEAHPRESVQVGRRWARLASA
jgi:hypothetical protein